MGVVGVENGIWRREKGGEGRGEREGSTLERWWWGLVRRDLQWECHERNEDEGE